ncbi:bifunctional 2-C-methyl-D-erythritol 4-phosphate cytidylyltransferase/2-C-methyl-D-erythritol 2,4-cyclodiphosphate synthase [Arcobacter sp. FWKO B]|uniref:bifunctional 2-C-methyl-D-erythritol 4-phosphate cytidylyltransferase/2-C-methyl-D-erythritol 2,4-cyclodiphosphate synthase n=1 Tax=Arcobacter sp. FWKO B TaxID=2593672 RepID=UPI0018A62D7B|nr:bifunctional 2-C-methyl-D-erythritol 4-phosphate cytidylyltransferase/2-C-methyl-D-erythritol 2,4-cyclodiphosphate synthase [Arcobacter sp. FWKO B]QOG12375.1 bifunctional 2-C-methyl-D-erythritol 4-phosphate cytidylyltransferase/2-C-methyl-D-erythritol 2,4-cyclodiphosphate synthase [Arcobacter sp. FWKO B]
MTDITLVVLCAGNSTRFGNKVKKQWLRVEDKPLWLFVTQNLSSLHLFDKVIVVGHGDEINYMKNFSTEFIYVQGGNTRQDSMKNALSKVDTPYVMFTDVARSCVPADVINELIANKSKADCIVPVIDVSDTVVFDGKTIDRDKTKLIQTPQLSKTQMLKKSLETSALFTDDSSAIASIGGTLFYTKGSPKSKKITFSDDIDDIECLKKPDIVYLNGNGFDIHPFEENKKMFLGGVHIPCEYGFKAHSDGDVLIHSVIDALLGAAGAGDIGEFFPDTDMSYSGIDSKILLEKIVDFIENVGFEIVNIDVTIIAQKPKISPYKIEIKESLSKLLRIKQNFLNIKATTAEKLGFIGRGEGVAVISNATIKYNNWTKQ